MLERTRGCASKIRVHLFHQSAEPVPDYDAMPRVNCVEVSHNVIPTTERRRDLSEVRVLLRHDQFLKAGAAIHDRGRNGRDDRKQLHHQGTRAEHEMTLLAASYEVSVNGTGRYPRQVYLRQSDFVLVSGYATIKRINRCAKLFVAFRFATMLLHLPVRICSSSAPSGLVFGCCSRTGVGIYG